MFIRIPRWLKCREGPDPDLSLRRESDHHEGFAPCNVEKSRKRFSYWARRGLFTPIKEAGTGNPEARAEADRITSTPSK